MAVGSRGAADHNITMGSNIPSAFPCGLNVDCILDVGINLSASGGPNGASTSASVSSLVDALPEAQIMIAMQKL